MRCFLLSGLALSSVLIGTAFADVTRSSDNWPELFTEAITPATEFTPYSYISDIDMTENEEVYTIRYSVHRTDGNAKFELLDFSDNAKEEDILEELNSESDEESDIWCDDFKESVGGSVDLVSEDDSHAVFAFMVNPDASEDRMERKIMKKTRMTVTVDKSTRKVTQFSYDLLEPVKPVIVAKVREFSLIGTCESQGEGRPYVTSIETRVSGSAMGSSFDQTSRQSIFDVTYLDHSETAQTTSP